MKRIWFAGLCLFLLVLSGYGQPSQDAVTDGKVVVFKFPFQRDTFYISGNDVELKLLYSYIDQYREAIASGKVSLYVNGYCSSFGEHSKNLQTASFRSHHVKSDLVLHKGLKEMNFVTANHADTYEGNGDVVTVTMRLPKEKPVEAVAIVEIPVPADEPEVVVAPNEEPVNVPEQPLPAVSVAPADSFITVYQAISYGGNGDTVTVSIPQHPGMQTTAGGKMTRDTLSNKWHPGYWDKNFTFYYTNVYEGGKDALAVLSFRPSVAEGETVEKVQEKKKDVVKQLPVRPKDPFRGWRFSLRTDLLYWLAVVPNAGLEWNPFDHWSILVNGLYNRMVLGGGEKQYRIEMVSPELRWHIGEDKRWFTGVEFHTGKYNFKLGETGYQGKMTGGGITGGYQVHLNPLFDMDFHLGLGYTKLEHDTYYRSSNGVLVRKETGLKKNFIGPTQAGVSFIWRINHSK
ncbi:hypothetical protein EZS27_002424 [termite gut metagenome]|uniref:DUF3575 domain-containing protein n=1 Tax=termite gut metagenome TaxID=433724 RepID=A0A5J4SW42_9ZZZZ